MPVSAERALWALLLAAAAIAPAVALVAVAALVTIAVARLGLRGSWERLGRLRRAWPVPLVLAVVALAALQGLAGLPWLGLIGLLVWGACLAVTLPRHVSSAARYALADAVLIGSLLAVITQVALSLPELATWFTGGGARAAGSTAHPNVLAAAMLVSAATLAVLAEGTRGARRALSLVALAPALLLVLASGSRAVVLGAAVGVVCWIPAALWSRSGRARRRTAWLALVVVISAPFALALVRGLPSHALLGSEVERGAVFSLALDLAAARPVTGHGAVAWTELLIRAEPSLPVGIFAHAHSVPLHVLVHAGALGLVLAAWLTLGGLRAALPRLAAAWGGHGPAAPLLAAAAGALALQALVDLVVISPALYLAVAGLLAALVAVARRYHPAR